MGRVISLYGWCTYRRGLKGVCLDHCYQHSVTAVWSCIVQIAGKTGLKSGTVAASTTASASRSDTQ